VSAEYTTTQVEEDVDQALVQLQSSVVVLPEAGLFMVTGQHPVTGQAINSSFHDTHEVLGPAIDGDCALFLNAMASLGDATALIAKMPIPTGIAMSDLLEP
jgi:hypothetical protein